MIHWEFLHPVHAKSRKLCSDALVTLGKPLLKDILKQTSVIKPISWMGYSLKPIPPQL